MILHPRRAQQGISLIAMIICSIVLVYFSVWGVRISVPYFQASIVTKIAEQSLEAGKTEVNPEKAIRENFVRKIQVEGTPVDFNELEIEPTEGRGWRLKVPMPAKFDLWKNAYIHLDIKVDVQSK